MVATVYYGTPVVGGLACAPLIWANTSPKLEVPVSIHSSKTPTWEVERFTAASQEVSRRLQQRSAQMVGTTSDVLAAQAQLAADPEVAALVEAKIRAGFTAEAALCSVIGQFCQTFKKAGGLLAERLVDLRDLGRRMLAELQDLPEPGIPEMLNPTILFASDLSPADTAGLDPDKILALVTEQGGPTSHISVIARQLGIPCMVATRGISALPDQTEVFVDATRGEVHLDFDRQIIIPLVHQDRLERLSVKEWQGPARLASGEEIPILANVQDGDSSRRAAQLGAQGVGLFRTELCFLGARTEPSIARQAAQYAEVLSVFKGQKVVVRTLDAGSDKPVSWASVPDEANPALGVRGLRTSGIDEGVLLRQLDAIQMASQQSGVSAMVMAPMVSTVDEARWVCGLIQERGMSAGIMIEVPAVALQVERYLPFVDFVSIGSNDLAQYVMSADRTNPNLATYTDPWQPAVLALISQVISTCRLHEVPVGICGEAAADPLLAAVLLGMQVSSISLAASSIPAVGSLLNRVTKTQIEKAATEVLAATNPGQARYLARKQLGLETLG